MDDQNMEFRCNHQMLDKFAKWEDYWFIVKHTNREDQEGTMFDDTMHISHNTSAGFA